MSYEEIVKRFLSKVLEIFNSHPRRREPGDGSDGTCDCIGLIIGAIRRMGLKWTGIHGSNWAARKELVKLEPINSVSDLKLGDIVLKGCSSSNKRWNLPSRYRPGGKYYNGDLNDYYHAGVVYSLNPLQIRHMASKMTIDTKLDHNKNSVWNYHGQSKILVNASNGTRPSPVPHNVPSSGKSAAVVIAEKGSTVNMRYKPSKASSIMVRVPLETKIEIIEPGEIWAKIKYNNKVGYMMAEFLDVIGDGKGKY